MSAFLCSDRHVVTLAVYACERGLSGDVVQAAMQLRAVNNAAMSARYKDAPQALASISAHIRWAQKRVAGMKTLADPWAHALAACLDYQCDEGDAKQTHGGALLARVLATAQKLSGGCKADVYALPDSDEDDTDAEVQS